MANQFDNANVRECMIRFNDLEFSKMEFMILKRLIEWTDWRISNHLITRGIVGELAKIYGVKPVVNGFKRLEELGFLKSTKWPYIDIDLTEQGKEMIEKIEAQLRTKAS